MENTVLAMMAVTKEYKFGKRLRKGEPVRIKEEQTEGGVVYTAYRSNEPTIAYGVLEGEFLYVGIQRVNPDPNADNEEGIVCMDCKTTLSNSERDRGGLCRDCRVSPYNPLDN